MIPEKIYQSYEFKELNKLLTKGELTLHWTDYNGQDALYDNIMNTIKVFSKYSRYIRMNVISYNTSLLEQRYKLSGHEGSLSKKRRREKAIEFSTLMIYTKIPERIFYGLLRHYGKDIYIKTNIYVERQGKYTKYDLEKRLLENLNTQSLYRAAQYWVNSCEQVPKGRMIGVELVDLLLGIIRQVIKNESVPPHLSEQELKEQKIHGRAKKQQLTIELLKIPDFYKFISNIMFYEWDSDKQLSEVLFKDYLEIFTSSNYMDFR
ncbi:MAG: hypothetical protein H0Z32_05270 [Bacillaceae bacterium]|nr:hypothetical protein [Bacillaceae bacterium]